MYNFNKFLLCNLLSNLQIYVSFYLKKINYLAPQKKIPSPEKGEGEEEKAKEELEKE